MKNQQRFIFLLVSTFIIVTIFTSIKTNSITIPQDDSTTTMPTVLNANKVASVTEASIIIEEETVQVRNTEDNEPSTRQEEAVDATEDDFDLFCRLIYAEAGSDWLSDHHILAVATVVMNRVSDPRFPNTVRGVIYQSGQYSPTWTGAIYNTPSQRVIDLCQKVWDGHREVPANVVWQANFRQGNGVYEAIYDETLGTTTYLCY